jgi:1-acyl-sn-glycerol-3-phosphate acyltransferase
MRTIAVTLTLLIATPILGSVVVISGLLGVPARPGGIYERCSRLWCWLINKSAGVKLRLHNPERIARDGARVYVSNHVSWFDVFALAQILPYYTFVAKAELAKIPVFGAAAKQFGVVFIERQNRKSAFTSYKSAAQQVRNGRSVVVCPEGTRGYDYHLRPFKKGPFVFAIAAGVPIVPTIIHGTIEIQRKGSAWVHAGTVDIHFLEPIETAGHEHDDRDQLMRKVWDIMAEEMESLYGTHTTENAIAPEGMSEKIPTSFL